MTAHAIVSADAPKAALSPSGLNHAQAAALMSAMGVPDVSAIDFASMSPEDRVTFITWAEQQLVNARERFDEVCLDAKQAVLESYGVVLAEIKKNGGKALAHDTFDVTVEQKQDYQKRIDVLRTLEGKLPDDLFHEAVYISGLDVSKCDPELVKQLVAAGAVPTWTANMTKLKKHASDFGGEIAKIVAEGAPKVDVGAPRLSIKPRASAMKVAH